MTYFPAVTQFRQKCWVWKKFTPAKWIVTVTCSHEKLFDISRASCMHAANYILVPLLRCALYLTFIRTSFLSAKLRKGLMLIIPQSNKNSHPIKMCKNILTPWLRGTKNCFFQIMKEIMVSFFPQFYSLYLCFWIFLFVQFLLMVSIYDTGPVESL